MIVVAPPLTGDRFRRPLEFLRSEHDRQLMICDRLIKLAGDRQTGRVIDEAEAQRRHICWENRTVLSFGLKRLSPRDEEELGRKMAARRGLILPR